MEDWKRYLLRRRRDLREQLDYVTRTGARLEEIVGDRRTDVSEDWMLKTELEYGMVNGLLADAGVSDDA